MGVWSFLRQFMYTKFVIVLDDDVDARNWEDVIWAITTRMDPARDTVMVENTPIDYLDFASPTAGWGPRWGSTPPTSGPARPPRVGRADRHGPGSQGTGRGALGRVRHRYRATRGALGQGARRLRLRFDTRAG